VGWAAHYSRFRALGLVKLAVGQESTHSPFNHSPVRPILGNLA
jgi:hypothetical protein